MRYPRSLTCLLATILLPLASVRCATAEEGNDRILLDKAAVVVDAADPSYVQYAIEELAGYLKDAAGIDLPVAATVDSARPVQILVGTEAVKKAFPAKIPDGNLGDEAYRLAIAEKDGRQYVIATGSSPRGTKLALAALMKAIQFDGNSVFLPSSLDISNKPIFKIRGMHLNGWAIGYPYTFRSWTEQDWYRYLDILAYQGVNLFYLWPFIEIMPVPLSPEDQAYLEECRRVVDYAQKKHGMEVWIMQCTNRVAQDRCGVADPRLRPYWRPSQKDLNPGKPEDFQAILASREAMYRIIDNADGICNIDSDPGFCPGSPVSDYVNVLQACRKLIDRYNLHGKDTKLINWMLWGWGNPGVGQTEGLAELELNTIQALKQGLPEPLWLISGQFPEYLPMCRNEGFVEKTVLLPYGTIEFEPAYPHTGVKIDAIRGTLNSGDARSPDIAGIMGNVQTPLIQFPNLYYFTSACCDRAYLDRSERDVMLELAGHLYPEQKELIADSFLALNESDPAKVSALADRLDQVVRENQLGRPGLIGRKLFPDDRIVAQSVVMQLRLRAAQERMMQSITPTTSQADCAKLLGDYFDAFLTWDEANGWHALWGWSAWPLGDFGPPTALAQKVRPVLATDAAVDACLEEVARQVSANHDAAIVEEGCIAPLRNAVKSIPAPAK